MSASLHIALLGSGQLGGSFALALRMADPSIRITAYDITAAHAEQLVQLGGATHHATTVANAVADADMVILASPVRAFRALATAMAPALKPGTIVTDLGSVKTSMLPLSALLPQARIVPAHPIAGSEKSGVAIANSELFRGKLCILTPDETTDAAARKAVETLWHLVGADVLEMPVAVHDHIYAYMSHLPHLVAFVAADFFYRHGVQIAADNETLQRFIRISRSNPRMWTDVFLENREALLPALATYLAMLEHFAAELRMGEAGHAADAAQLAGTHLPRILAASLISSVALYEQQSGMSLKGFGAGGMRDIAAPAAIDPEAATQEISGVAHAMAAVIEAIIPTFHMLEAIIGAEDEPTMFRTLTSMVEHAHALIAQRQ